MTVINAGFFCRKSGHIRTSPVGLVMMWGRKLTGRCSTEPSGRMVKLSPSEMRMEEVSNEL